MYWKDLILIYEGSHMDVLGIKLEKFSLQKYAHYVVQVSRYDVLERIALLFKLACYYVLYNFIIVSACSLLNLSW